MGENKTKGMVHKRGGRNNPRGVRVGGKEGVPLVSLLNCWTERKRCLDLEEPSHGGSR